MNKRLESLQAELTGMLNAHDVPLHSRTRFAELLEKVYTTVVQDCRAALPPERDDAEWHMIENGKKLEGYNACRTEADKALEALLP